MAKWISKLSPEERLTKAKDVLSKVADVIEFLLPLHETNKIVVLSDYISKQIGPSYAANSYNNFARSLLEIELVRLCSLWDKPEENAYTIRTIIDLIDDPSVIHLMSKGVADFRRSTAKDPLYIRVPVGQKHIDVMKTHFQIADADAKNEYQKITIISRNVIKMSNLIYNSDRLLRVKNFRNKNIAHALSRTIAENKRNEPIDPPKVRDVGKLIFSTVRIMGRLWLCVNSGSYAWDSSKLRAKRDAEALWHGVTIEALR